MILFSYKNMYLKEACIESAFVTMLNLVVLASLQLEFAGREDIPVSEGFRTSLRVRTYKRLFSLLVMDSIVFDTISGRGLIITFCIVLWQGAVKEHIADFVHGSDGLGNTHPTLSDRKPIDTFAPDFLIQKVNEFPGEVTIVALGPLTNLAKVHVLSVLKFLPVFGRNTTSLLNSRILILTRVRLNFTLQL